MSQRKPRIAVIFGGRSGEHEVSLMSARSVLQAIDRERFDVVPIGITREGRWLLLDDPARALEAGVESAGGTPVAMLGDPTRPGLSLLDGSDSSSAGGGNAVAPAPRAGVAAPSPALGGIEVVFPVLHGPLGEDGTVQGLLELADVPYVGAGVLASALGMDKDLMKTVFAQRGIPVPRHRLVLRGEWDRARQARTEDDLLAEVEGAFGYPCFVKPANMGSSVGVSKAKDREGLRAALDLAAHYDRKILVEEFVDGREIECSVLGNDDPEASVPGEIVPSNEFYDYRAKYVDGQSGLIIPADLPPAVAEEVRRLAVAAFRALDCAGMARVDFFVERRARSGSPEGADPARGGLGRVLVNEVNTIPGFTQISMYPKLWEASGLSYRDLITRLVELALERHADKSRSSRTYDR